MERRVDRPPFLAALTIILLGLAFCWADIRRLRAEFALLSCVNPPTPPKADRAGLRP